ncbi:MAG: hypothetical protein AAF376_02735 [Pseudomonadota bacterium]
MLISGSYFIFSDTNSYIKGGQILFEYALRIVTTFIDGFGGASAGAGADGGGSASVGPPAMTNDRGEPFVMRSFVYALYAYLAGGRLWPAGFAILQTAATIWTLFALIDARALHRPWVLTTGVVLIAAFSTLPWFTVYLMPDILGATIIIYAAVLMVRFDDLSRTQITLLCLIATFAAASHYGHGPLAAAILAVVVILRALRRQLSRGFVLAAAIPVLFSPVANLTVSAVALDRPEVTPLRLPILLARSLQDGPAYWYLQDACPDASYAFCEAFGDDLPRWIGDFLWDEDGIDSLTPDLLQRIRDEEVAVIWAAFKAYPAQQAWSFFGNSVKQVVQVGTGNISPADREPSGHLARSDDETALALLQSFDRIVMIMTWLATLIVFVLWITGRLTKRQRDTTLVLLAGVILNALIFGGLSAPVDRYQSRIIWVFPALAVIFLAEGPKRRISAD